MAVSTQKKLAVTKSLTKNDKFMPFCSHLQCGTYLMEITGSGIKKRTVMAEISSSNRKSESRKARNRNVNQ